MLVTTADEIRAYLPTSVYSGDDSLLALMEDTEESVLVPVLGRGLYEKVCEDYGKAIEEYGGVTPQVIAKEDLTPEIRLIRHCQLPVVYLTLANSTGILSVNLNEGGGLNQSYTEMFDNADKDAVGRFERDAWFKGHRGIDRLLLFLENDARSKAPVFAELWHKSRYFYFQGDLLFTTACRNDEPLFGYRGKPGKVHCAAPGHPLLPAVVHRAVNRGGDDRDACWLVHRQSEATGGNGRRRRRCGRRESGRRGVAKGGRQAAYGACPVRGVTTPGEAAQVQRERGDAGNGYGKGIHCSQSGFVPPLHNGFAAVCASRGGSPGRDGRGEGAA